MSRADGRFLVLDDVRRIGPFSSHWAACAAMIRMSDPDFRSMGRDKPEDVAMEAMIRPRGSVST